MLLLIIPSIIISFSPVFIKLIDLPPSTIAFYRCFFAFLVLTPWFFKKSISLQQIIKKNYFSVIASGLFFCADLYTWHRAVLLTGAGFATVLANTQVFYLHILGWAFFKEKLSFKFLLLSILGFAGLLLLVNPFYSVFTANYFRGVLLGLMSGIFYSFFLFFLRFSKIHSQRVKIAHISLWASIFLFFILLYEDTLKLPKMSDLPSILVLSVLIQAFCWILISQGMKKFSLSIVGLVLLLQPVLAIIWGRLFFLEYLSAIQYVGAGIVLVSVYLSQLIDLKQG